MDSFSCKFVCSRLRVIIMTLFARSLKFEQYFPINKHKCDLNLANQPKQAIRKLSSMVERDGDKYIQSKIYLYRNSK